MFDAVIYTGVILLLILFPGYLLFKLYFPRREIAIIESPSLFFAAGLSFIILPMLISYLFRCTWMFFIVLWSAEILIVIAMLMYRKISIMKNIFVKPDRYDLMIALMIVVVSVPLFIKGGHFTGDATAHLASIVKLSECRIIDPAVPMFRGIDQVAFNYAFSIHYGLFALVQKVSGIELKVIWNLSPGLFPMFIFSALFFFADNFFEKKVHVFITLVVFFLYEFTIGWKDFIFLPYPDQIARNVLLFVAFGSIFHSIRGENARFQNTLFISSIIVSMMFVHMYSFFAFFFIATVFSLMSPIFVREKEVFRRQLVILCVNALICLPFLLIRLFGSNYGKIYLYKWFN